MDSEKNHLLDDFFRKYSNIVVKNAYLFVKDYYAAEDICQETFIRLAQNLDRVKPEKVGRWLICVSERLAIDYLRKGGSVKVSLGLDGIQDTLADRRYSDLSSMLEEKEDRELQKSALICLRREKPVWYDTMLMSYVEEMDNGTIGSELGVKASLVSKWKERARLWLLSKYEEKRDVLTGGLGEDIR